MRYLYINIINPFLDPRTFLRQASLDEKARGPKHKHRQILLLVPLRLTPIFPSLQSIKSAYLNSRSHIAFATSRSSALEATCWIRSWRIHDHPVPSAQVLLGACSFMRQWADDHVASNSGISQLKCSFRPVNLNSVHPEGELPLCACQMNPYIFSSLDFVHPKGIYQWRTFAWIVAFYFDLVSGQRVNGCDEMGSGIICNLGGLYLRPMKESFPGRLIASRHRQSPDTCNNGPSSPTSGTEGSRRRKKKN